MHTDVRLLDRLPAPGDPGGRPGFRTVDDTGVCGSAADPGVTWLPTGYPDSDAGCLPGASKAGGA